jgi:hypothetical protein
MSESTLQSQFCGQSSLAAVGNYLRQIDLLAPIQEQVQIAQKTVKYTPFDKLCDAFLLLLSGTHHMVEINTRLRADPALCQAFGRKGCAEQSVVQDTLDACTDPNIEQMQHALTTIFRKRSHACRHDYTTRWQLLDIDLSGRVCGKGAEQATKGYFARQKSRRGRQEGRVYASLYEETVTVRLFAGNTNTSQAVLPLVEAAEEVLALTPQQRTRTILRMDAGAGTLEEVNACLKAGYQFHGKDYSSVRARHLAQSVSVWYDDPKIPGRQVGLVTAEPNASVRPVVRIAVRCPRKKGEDQISVLISTLSSEDVLALRGHASDVGADPSAVLLAYVYFYDARGGGIECGFKQDRQGLGRRNKKCFAAQAMLLCLESLAHNVLIWARDWLKSAATVLAGYGLLRLVRDALSIPGRLCLDRQGQIRTLVLYRAHPLALKMQAALQLLLAQQGACVCLGEI